MPHLERATACLFGAFVADAAALGLHWIYDTARIAEIAARNNGKSAFTPIDPQNFEGVPAYFAHAKRADGMLSQYGETLRLMIRSIIEHEGFDTASYQAAYAEHFGPGGKYQGYIDRPTRGTLENIAAGQVDPSGVNDDQHPAISTLPAIIALYHDASDLAARVEAAIRITNVNETASAYGQVLTELLTQVLAGAPIAEALRASAEAADSAARPGLLDALNTDERNSVAYGEITQRACHLPMGLPLSFHIVAHSESFATAVENNIKAGGDSAGRAIMIGAVMGARHGIDGPTGIPMEWALRLTDGLSIWRDCQKIGNLARKARLQ